MFLRAHIFFRVSGSEKMLKRILKEIQDIKKRIIRIEKYLRIEKEISEPIKELLQSRIEECINGKAIEFSLIWKENAG